MYLAYGASVLVRKAAGLVKVEGLNSDQLGLGTVEIWLNQYGVSRLENGIFFFGNKGL